MFQKGRQFLLHLLYQNCSVLVFILWLHGPTVSAFVCFDWSYDFLLKIMFSTSLLRFVLSEFNFSLMLLVFIYAYWCPIRFPYQLMLSFDRNTMCGTGAFPRSTSVHSGIVVVFVDHCLSFYLFSFGHGFFLPFDLRLLNSPLVSSTFSQPTVSEFVYVLYISLD